MPLSAQPHQHPHPHDDVYTDHNIHHLVCDKQQQQQQDFDLAQYLVDDDDKDLLLSSLLFPPIAPTAAAATWPPVLIDNESTCSPSSLSSLSSSPNTFGSPLSSWTALATPPTTTTHDTAAEGGNGGMTILPPPPPGSSQGQEDVQQPTTTTMMRISSSSSDGGQAVALPAGIQQQQQQGVMVSVDMVSLLSSTTTTTTGLAWAAAPKEAHDMAPDDVGEGEEGDAENGVELDDEGVDDGMLRFRLGDSTTTSWSLSPCALMPSSSSTASSFRRLVPWPDAHVAFDYRLGLRDDEHDGGLCEEDEGDDDGPAERDSIRATVDRSNVDALSPPAALHATLPLPLLSRPSSPSAPPLLVLTQLQSYMAYLEARHAAYTLSNNNDNISMGQFQTYGSSHLMVSPPPPPAQQHQIVHASAAAPSPPHPSPSPSTMGIPTSLPALPRLRSSSSHTLTMPPAAFGGAAGPDVMPPHTLTGENRLATAAAAAAAPSPFSRALNKTPSLTVDEASNSIDWTGLLDRELGVPPALSAGHRDTSAERTVTNDSEDEREDDVDMDFVPAVKRESPSASPASTEVVAPRSTSAKRSKPSAAAPTTTTTSHAGRRRVSDPGSTTSSAPMSKLDRRREINRRSAAKLREHRKVELEEARATINGMERRLTALEEQLEAERQWRRSIVAVCLQGGVDLSKLVPLPCASASDASSVQEDVE